MVRRRFILMVVTSALLLATTVQPALATRPPVSRPIPPPVAPPAPPAPPAPAPEPDPVPEPVGERALTAQERADAAAKEAAAESYLASVARTDPGLASLACVPNSPPQHPTQAPALGATSADATTDAETLGCQTSVPQDYLAVEARDQINGWYCGPAVGQVIANYSWATRPGTDRYSQTQIGKWMSTGTAGTNAGSLEAGLETATSGSPRRPSNWNWVISYLWDSDGDGWSGDQLYAYVRANITGSRMPLAFAVKPHDANAPNGAHLASWPNVVQSPGHWIAIYGWYRVHDGSDRARLYYTDSSRDEGGATGKYWTSTWWFTIMILDHTRYIVW